MAITVTSNFAGKAAGFYISAALKASNSLDYLTMIENIKFKSNIQAMNQTVNSVVDATCDFNAAGTLALTEKVFSDMLPLSGFILTKPDGVSRGGSALSVKLITG